MLTSRYGNPESPFYRPEYKPLNPFSITPYGIQVSAVQVSSSGTLPAAIEQRTTSSSTLQGPFIGQQAAIEVREGCS